MSSRWWDGQKYCCVLEDPWEVWTLETSRKNSTHKFTRSASSVAVECIFSTMGLILNGKLSRLSGDQANAISFIHDNFAFLDMV